MMIFTKDNLSIKVKDYILNNSKYLLIQKDLIDKNNNSSEIVTSEKYLIKMNYEYKTLKILFNLVSLITMSNVYLNID